VFDAFDTSLAERRSKDVGVGGLSDLVKKLSSVFCGLSVLAVFLADFGVLLVMASQVRYRVSQSQEGSKRKI
jgi:hypothetical protein